MNIFDILQVVLMEEKKKKALHASSEEVNQSIRTGTSPHLTFTVHDSIKVKLKVW